MPRSEDSDADGGAKRGRVTAHYIVQRSSGLEEDEGRRTRALAGRYFPLVALRCRRSSCDLCLRLPIIRSFLVRSFVPPPQLPRRAPVIPVAYQRDQNRGGAGAGARKSDGAWL